MSIINEKKVERRELLKNLTKDERWFYDTYGKLGNASEVRRAVEGRNSSRYFAEEKHQELKNSFKKINLKEHEKRII
jgi:hypothetical protein